MVLEGAATVLQAVAEVKKTGNWLKDAGEATAECSEAEKTEYGREGERETSLECPIMKLSNGGPYACPTAEKTEYGDKNAGEAQAICQEEEKTEYGNKNGGETQPECQEVEKTEYGHERKRETSLEHPLMNGSNGGCPYICPSAKKTGNVDKNVGETQAECVEEEKTEYGHEGKRGTSLEYPGSNGGCPYACPSVIIPSLRPQGHLDAPSPRLAELLEGAEIPGDSGHPPDPPEWLDRELFNEGRKFYQNYLFCLTFSELLSLLLVLAQGHVLKPLIHTGRSDSEVKARRRYLSTLFHLMSWFEGDVWDTSSPSRRDIIGIRTTHRRLGQTFNQSGEYEKVLNVSVQARGHRQPPESLLPALKKDLRAAGVKEWKRRKEEKEEEYPVIISHGKEEKKEEKEEQEKEAKKNLDFVTQGEEAKKKKDEAKKMVPKLLKEEEEKTKKKEDQEEFPVFISQLDMSLTQYSFMGLLLAHPTKLGAGGATTREMESLVHFWRGLGWLLGIEDQYNFCSGSLKQTRELCLEVERDILLPRLSEANWDYEHMVNSLIEGMSQFLHMLSLPAMLRYLAHTLDIPAPALSRSLTWRQLLQYWLMRFTFGVIYYTPGFLRRLNPWFLDVIAKVKEEDKVNLAAYRKAQAALTVPLKGSGVRNGVSSGV